MWAEPQLEPVYQAVRSYLELDQRVGLLTERLDVIADLLAVLKDQLTHTHGEFSPMFPCSYLDQSRLGFQRVMADLFDTGEYLEWIVIVLIAAEHSPRSRIRVFKFGLCHSVCTKYRVRDTVRGRVRNTKSVHRC